MELYSENEQYKLYHGNMLDMLNYIEGGVIDSIVTDPPYELNFMGKGWDNSGIAFNPDTWKKCLEVLKPGGYLLAFGGSRTYHRIACAIEDAGFEIRDCIMWLYGSGFPKSMDISKQIDKRGATSISRFGEYLRGVLKEKNMTYSDLAKHFLSKTGGITGCVHNRIEGKNMPTLEQFNKICDILDLPFDKLEEAEREVIGSKKTNLTVYQNIGDRNISGEIDITAPSTDLAKQRAGWGTALKPSYEPIIVARKPLEGSCTDNVIKYGVGGINIDECRVGTETISIHNAPAGTFAGGEYDRGSDTESYRDSVGRFPANTILTYGEEDKEEVCSGFPDTKGGNRHNTATRIEDSTSYGGKAGYINTRNEFNDEGSAARYFYCAKASKRDRDEGLQEFETKTKVFNGQSDKPSTEMKDVEKRFTTQGKNTHPTVKPCDLMQYLVRLVTPNGGTVLDPFNGSGSTGKAVMYENKDRNKNYKYIGIELTDEYLPIAKARIEYAINVVEEKEEDKQPTLFDI